MASLTSRLIITVLILSTIAGASRILGVFPHPAYSLQMTLRSLTVELARRGHELIVFTTDPMNNVNFSVKYTEIDLHYLYDTTTSPINFYTSLKEKSYAYVQNWLNFNERITDEVLSHPAMQRLISPNSTAKFDLIIVPCAIYDALFALSIRLNAPLIAITTIPLAAFHNLAFGNPLLPSSMPEWFGGYDDNMNLWQRFANIYYQLTSIYNHRYIILPKQERVCRKHFGNTVPPVHQLASHVSLILVNAHPFFIYPRPNIPAIVYIGGLQLQREKNKLPQDLVEILNDAKEGFIYFSLGTNVKSDHLPIERHNMFLKVFAALPYKILWKFESDYLASKLDNVVIRKWLPQRAILAHPNIRLFISQGGIHSIEEAIENAIPMINFPIAIDQSFNTRRLQNLGAGKVLSLTDVNEDEFRETILEVITNSSYKENMVKLSNLLQDLPQKPMDTAVWWVEHVIRHKGATHLRNKSRDIPWYQDQMLDLMAIMFGTIAFVIYIMVSIIRLFIRQYSVQKRAQRDSKKQN